MDREVILLIGSNIQPRENIARVLAMLKDKFDIVGQSSIWETDPVESRGDSYLNLAIAIRTHLQNDLLRQSLRDLETALGRQRVSDKYAPRTMDLDIILDDGQVMDDKLWQYSFVAVPVSQLASELIEPSSGKELSVIAKELENKSRIVELPSL